MLNRKWSVFLYAVMISFFAVLIGYIISIKIDTLMENLDIQNYDIKLHSNITEKANLSTGYSTFLNTNGSGFVNTILCPDSVTMSGTYAGWISVTIPTIPFFNNTSFACSWSTLEGNLLLLYSSGGTFFTTGSYRWSTISLNPGGSSLHTGTFSDGSGTFLSFTATWTLSDIDLDGNSDNFQTSSTGIIMYPNDQFDDDDLARKTFYGYLKKDIGWYNVFVMNTPVRKYIGANIHNTTPYFSKAWDTQTGYLRLDIDNPYSIKIAELDKTQFESIQEMRILTENITSFSTGGIGWVMPDLTLSGVKDWAKVFDLKNKDYAIFLSFSGNLTNTWIDFLKYKISMENENGSGIYIVPIDDSTSGITKYLGTDILIDQEGKYRYKQFEVAR